MKKNVLFILAFLLIIFTSCSDQFVKGVYIGSNNEYSLNVETSSLQTIPAEGGVIDIIIRASNAVNWEIRDLPLWISAPIVSGTGTQEIKFIVEPNESFTTSRTQIFNIVSMNSDWLVTLPVSATQLKKSSRLSLSPSDNSSWTFDSEGGHKELIISSNIEWTAECESDFVSLSKTSGNGDGTLIVTVAPYNKIDVTSNRTASVYFKESSHEEILQVLTITQTPLQDSIESETINVEFEKTPGSRSYSLGEIKGTYSVRSDATWLTVMKNNDSLVDITLSVSSNGNEDERTSNAYVFFDSTNSIKYIFKVRQEGNIIILEPDIITFDANGGSYNVKIDADTSWKTTNTNEWLTVQENSNSCTVSVTENNSLDSRSGEVLFNRIDINGNIIGKTARLQVSQKGRSISYDSEILQFGPDSSTQTLNIESDTQWTLRTLDDWIYVSVSEGYGNKAVTVSVVENTTSANRVGKLKLDCLGKTKEISVIQESAYLNTSSTSIDIEAVGGRASVTLSSNVLWTASSSEQWLSVTPESGNGETTIELSATPNYNSGSRTAVVTISSKLGKMMINVKQKAPSISVSQNSVEFGYQGGSSSPILIMADGNYTVNCLSEWILYKQEANTLILSVDENEGAERKGTIVISLKNVNISTTINVTQKAPPYTFVNLGLPSGTIWCNWNLGAESKENYGSYFTWENAKKQVPKDCEMPSYDQAYELLNKCIWTWTSINGVSGYLGKGLNGNTIFLPAGGYYGASTNMLTYEGNVGEFWVNSDNTSGTSPYPTARIIEFMYSAGVTPKISGAAQAARLNLRFVKKR